jgi:hypothetical protein
MVWFNCITRFRAIPDDTASDAKGGEADAPALGLVDAGGEIDEGSGLALDDQKEGGLSGRGAGPIGSPR